jgi:hypothetical protein
LKVNSEKNSGISNPKEAKCFEFIINLTVLFLKSQYFLNSPIDIKLEKALDKNKY